MHSVIGCEVARLFRSAIGGNNFADEGRAVVRHRTSDGFQTGDGSVENLATLERTKSVAESYQRSKVHRRNRSRVRNQIRRLIHAVTQNPG